MSDRTATRSVPAKESSTTSTTTTTSMTTPAATTILAIDLGKFKSVACRYDPATGGHAFDTIATTTVAVQADRESRSSLRHLE
jgi:hypothetical protein